MLFYLLVCVVYIGIYNIGCNICAKKCLLKENVPINWKCNYWPKRCVSKKYLLKCHNHLYWIKCILNENVPIGRKCAYWMKMYLLTENVSIGRKVAYQNVYIERS